MGILNKGRPTIKVSKEKPDLLTKQEAVALRRAISRAMNRGKTVHVSSHDRIQYALPSQIRKLASWDALLRATVNLINKCPDDVPDPSDQVRAKRLLRLIEDYFKVSA